MTRQNTRKLMLTNALEFPVPIHEGNTSVWHLSDILTWLNARGGYQMDEYLPGIAKTIKQVNLAKEAGEIESGVINELEALVA